MLIKSMDDFQDNVYSRMDYVYRFSDTKLIERESDLHHVGAMIFLSLAIIDDIRDFYKDPSLIDEKDLISRIVMHDLDEICDIPRTMKYSSEEFHQAVNKSSDEMMLKLGMSPERLDQIHRAKTDDCIEAELCKLIDMLQCNVKLREEYYLQHTPRMRSRYIESLENTIKNFDDRIKNKNCKQIIKILKFYQSLMIKELGKIESEN